MRVWLYQFLLLRKKDLINILIQIILLYVDPGWAVNLIPENINTPFFAVWVVVPVNVGVYVAPEYVPEILNVEVELLSDPTICPNSSTSAIYIVDIDPPLCWLGIDKLVESDVEVKLLLLKFY